MIFFRSDYSSGAHPRIIEALAKTNLEHTDGYSLDPHCENAAALIKKRLGDDSLDIHFTVGGTITNLTAIAAWLRPYQAAVSVASGHIYVHETGAIEATGHKVIAMPGKDGKLTPDDILAAVEMHKDEHMVQPKLAYISNSTETGTIYTKAELKALHDCCLEKGMYLYMDGARLGSALTAEGNDVAFADLPQLTDAFYIGGTKNGFLFGEALVISNPALKSDFRYMIKQRGGMFAKGRLLGLQFEEMFRDNLYFDIAADTNRRAKTLRDGIAAKGYKFMSNSPSNQVFPIFKAEKVAELEKKYFFLPQEYYDDGTIAIRLVCSWSTTDKDIEAFLADI